MNYYFDTEFLEGPQKKRITDVLKDFPLIAFVFTSFTLMMILNYAFNITDHFIALIPFVFIFLTAYMLIIHSKNKPTIDLISIGIVCEDGREFYAISKDFNLKEAWNRYELKPKDAAEGYNDNYSKKDYWIRENVLRPIFDELVEKYNNTMPYVSMISDFSYRNMKTLIKRYGKSNEQIAREIVGFCYEIDGPVYHLNSHSDSVVPNNIKFHAYYADYDWVVFCWLFGRMIDLPKGFPMYCVDIKQVMDEKVTKVVEGVRVADGRGYITRKEALDKILSLPEYPKNKKPHHALSDAKFDRDLHNFLNKI